MKSSVLCLGASQVLLLPCIVRGSASLEATGGRLPDPPNTSHPWSTGAESTSRAIFVPEDRVPLDQSNEDELLAPGTTEVDHGLSTPRATPSNYLRKAHVNNLRYRPFRLLWREIYGQPLPDDWQSSRAAAPEFWIASNQLILHQVLEDYGLTTTPDTDNTVQPSSAITYQTVTLSHLDIVGCYMPINYLLYQDQHWVQAIVILRRLIRAPSTPQEQDHLFSKPHSLILHDIMRNAILQGNLSAVQMLLGWYRFVRDTRFDNLYMWAMLAAALGHHELANNLFQHYPCLPVGLPDARETPFRRLCLEAEQYVNPDMMKSQAMASPDRNVRRRVASAFTRLRPVHDDFVRLPWQPEDVSPEVLNIYLGLPDDFELTPSFARTHVLISLPFSVGEGQ
ncbi:hypothetical protein IWQ60_002870 [Tieghemiomyces parasiticus]|uniref:Uncharacterized protein n=1 Tax=Tieghemiomyces parasiticus TaxID=78921 RepID=A0A9W8DX08_9FUNG|nr:hypothetical protein IWQ60_002870 [Tieghemiomyces parasiticus]